MKTVRTLVLVLLALFALMLAATAPARAAEYWSSPELDAAWNDDNLLQKAPSADFETLIALAWMVDAKDARDAILDRLTATAKDSTGIAAAIALDNLDQVDTAWLNRWSEAEPDNAAPLYLMAWHLFMHEKRPDEALAVFEKASARAEFQPYRQSIHRTLPKAFDALGLAGRTRLAAWHKALLRGMGSGGYSTGMAYQALASLVMNSIARQPQPRAAALAEGTLTLAGRAMTMDTLLADPTLAAALGAKALAEQDPAKKSAYDRAGVALYANSAAAEASEWRFQFLMALTTGLYGKQNRQMMVPGPFKASDEQVARMGQLCDQMIDIAERVPAAVTTDQDRIMGDMLTGGPLAISSPFEKSFPQVYADVRKFTDALEEFRRATESVPSAITSRQNLKMIGLGIGMYQADYAEALPPDFKTLINQGYLKDPAITNSPLDGKPFVYVGAGIDMTKQMKPGTVILAYEDYDLGDGSRNVLFGDLHVGAASAADFAAMMKAQGR